MSCAHSPTFPSLHLRHNSFSNPSVASLTSQLILQPFFRFSCVTGSSLTSPSELPMITILFQYILEHSVYLVFYSFVYIQDFLKTLFNLSFITCPVHRCGAGGSMHASNVAGPGSIPVRTSFLGEVFSGFFLTCKTSATKLWAHKDTRTSFGHHNHPFIFTLLEWMGAWIVCIVFQVRVVSEVAPADSSSREALHVLV